MYLQITTRCNMTCAHCCFSCTKDGEDMSLETFRAAVGLDYKITLGGGEPTLHRHFNTILLESMAAVKNSLWVVTNGSITRKALLLASLSKSGLITAQLSRDKYHDKIDPVVVEAFEATLLINELPEGIRNTTKLEAPVLHGRGVALAGLDAKNHSRKPYDCMVSNFFVKPNGDIFQCSCEDSPKVGEIKNGFDMAGMPRRCCHGY